MVAAVCCRRADPVATEEEPRDQKLPPARITETVPYPDDKCTAYNFEYPSRDPYGKPVTLSGSILIGDEVVKETPARGLLLYNHFTAYGADECPSRGELTVQKMMVGSGLITISADYYGFGATESFNQAYCLGNANGQASVDALLQAVPLLENLGYTWDNVIFNVGYSQGGQTAVANVKTASQQYPELRFTHTFAGGGPYDMPTTYRSFVSSGKSSMADTVIYVMLAFNEFYKLDIPLDAIFREPLLSHLDQWFFSKDYTRKKVHELVGTDNLSELFTPEIMDPESDISKKFAAAAEKENLCKGWAPWLNETITVIHNNKDDVVPVENAVNLIRFLSNHGLTVDSRLEETTLILNVLSPHYLGAVPFFTETLSGICSTLDISPWISTSSVVRLLSSM